MMALAISGSVGSATIEDARLSGDCRDNYPTYEIATLGMVVRVRKMRVVGSIGLNHFSSQEDEGPVLVYTPEMSTWVRTHPRPGSEYLLTVRSPASICWTMLSPPDQIQHMK